MEDEKLPVITKYGLSAVYAAFSFQVLSLIQQIHSGSSQTCCHSGAPEVLY